MLHARRVLLLLPLLITACVVDDEPELGTDSSELVTEVPSVAGLPGFYVRLPAVGLPGEMLTMWLAGEAHGDTSDGTYTRTVAPFYAVETGGYHAIPNNPAIGWAAITFVDDETGDFDAYFIGGIVTEPLTGKIVTLSLIHVLPDGEFGLPFLMQRLY